MIKLNLDPVRGYLYLEELEDSADYTIQLHRSQGQSDGSSEVKNLFGSARQLVDRIDDIVEKFNLIAGQLPCQLVV